MIERRYALVLDGALVRDSAGAPVVSAPVSVAPEAYSEAYPAGAEWLPVEVRDAEGFDLAEHYRLPPVITFEGGKVFQTYPHISKIDYHAKELGIPAETFRAMVGGAR